MGVKMPDSDRAKPFQSVLLSGGSTKRLESSRKSSRMLALMSPAWAPSAALGVGRMEEKTLGHGLKEKILNSAAVKKGKAKGKEKERQRSGGVVSTGQPGRAIKTEEDGFAQAAILLCHADHLLIAAGAGFSADSGLPVYKDIANVEAYHRMGLTYADLCDPVWMRRDPEVFYGFWGKCFNDYMDTEPHEGYRILKGWTDAMFGPVQECETIPDTKSISWLARSSSTGGMLPRPSTTAGKLLCRGTSSSPFSDRHSSKPATAQRNSHRRERSYFVYTSNVDTMFSRAGFDKDKVFEIHGNVVDWQCGHGCEAKIWSLTAEHRFAVGDDMRAPRNRPAQKEDGNALCCNIAEVVLLCEEEKGGGDSEFVGGGGVHAVRSLLNRGNTGGLSCYSGGVGREAAAGAHRPGRMTPNHVQCRGCGRAARPNILMFEDDDWEPLEEPPKAYQRWKEASLPCRMVVLEGGCGKRVPTVRMNSNSLLRKGASMIRINTYDGHASTPDPVFGAKAVSLKCGVLHALTGIDTILQQMLADCQHAFPLGHAVKCRNSRSEC